MTVPNFNGLLTSARIALGNNQAQWLLICSFHNVSFTIQHPTSFSQIGQGRGSCPFIVWLYISIMYISIIFMCCSQGCCCQSWIPPRWDRRQKRGNNILEIFQMTHNDSSCVFQGPQIRWSQRWSPCSQPNWNFPSLRSSTGQVSTSRSTTTSMTWSPISSQTSFTSISKIFHHKKTEG